LEKNPNGGDLAGFARFRPQFIRVPWPIPAGLFSDQAHPQEVAFRGVVRISAKLAELPALALDRLVEIEGP
jgi:hypothetical protein